MYNLPEKNPHLSNQRLEGGRVNIRNFRIPQHPEQHHDLMRNQFVTSVERVGLNQLNRTFEETTTATNNLQREQYDGHYAPTKLIIRVNFSLFFAFSNFNHYILGTFQHQQKYR